MPAWGPNWNRPAFGTPFEVEPAIETFDMITVKARISVRVTVRMFVSIQRSAVHFTAALLGLISAHGFRISA